MIPTRPKRKWRWKTLDEDIAERDALLFNQIYYTTFCNQAHRVGDGKPIEHECYVLNPEQLKLEANGEYLDPAVNFRTEKIHCGIPLSDTEVTILPRKVPLELP